MKPWEIDYNLPRYDYHNGLLSLDELIERKRLRGMQHQGPGVGQMFRQSRRSTVSAIGLALRLGRDSVMLLVCSIGPPIIYLHWAGPLTR